MFSKLDNFLWKHEKKIKIITLLLALVAGFFAVSSWKNSLIGASVALYLFYFFRFFRAFLESKFLVHSSNFVKRSGFWLGFYRLHISIRCFHISKCLLKASQFSSFLEFYRRLLFSSWRWLPTNFLEKNLGKIGKNYIDLPILFRFSLWFRSDLQKIGRFFRSPFSILYS